MREDSVKSGFNGGQLGWGLSFRVGLGLRMGLGLRVGLTLALLLLAQLVQGASAVHKCVINGNVTFQSGPCPADKPSRQPTVDELNALRKKRLAEAALVAASAPPAAPAPSQNGPQMGSPTGSQAGSLVGSKPAVPPASNPPAQDAGLRCDGRQHCSQMRSCSEAKYFLANCPGVKMDGDRNGIPCEQQWCTGPLAK